MTDGKTKYYRPQHVDKNDPVHTPRLHWSDGGVMHAAVCRHKLKESRLPRGKA